VITVQVYRAVQYLARFLAFYAFRKGYSKETIARLNNLKSTLATSRKRKRALPFHRRDIQVLKPSCSSDASWKTT
jgi:hypothetical protein